MDRVEPRGFPRRGTGSPRQGNCSEPSAEPACSSAKRCARGQETIMKRTRQLPALIGLAVSALIGGFTLGAENQRAPAPLPAKWERLEPRRESDPPDGL